MCQIFLKNYLPSHILNIYMQQKLGLRQINKRVSQVKKLYYSQASCPFAHWYKHISNLAVIISKWNLGGQKLQKMTEAGYVKVVYSWSFSYVLTLNFFNHPVKCPHNTLLLDEMEVHIKAVKATLQSTNITSWI